MKAVTSITERCQTWYRYLQKKQFRKADVFVDHDRQDKGTFFLPVVQNFIVL